MGKINPQRDEIISPYSGDTRDETHISPEGSLPPGRPTAEPSSSSSWTARLKRRWESMLAWLAKGAEHACPT